MVLLELYTFSDEGQRKDESRCDKTTEVPMIRRHPTCLIATGVL
jgi:hypothetical protein